MAEADDIFYLCYTARFVLAILLWLQRSGTGHGESAYLQHRAFIGEWGELSMSLKWISGVGIAAIGRYHIDG